MKKVYLLMSFLFVIALSVKAQQNFEDVVYLKNGSIIHGVIIEQIPNQSIKIQTKDGNVFVYTISEVQKMTKEQVAPTYTVTPKYQPSVNPQYKNPNSAMLWSLLLTGGGQFYNGENSKAIIMLGANVVSWGCYFIGAPYYDNYNGDYYEPSALYYLGIVGILGTGIWSVLDASNSAKVINRKNGLALNFKLNKNLDLALQPDYKLDYYGGNRPMSVFGAKLSLNLH